MPLFGRKVQVELTVVGMVGNRLVNVREGVRVKAPADVRTVLAAARRIAGADLLAALDAGAEPSLLLDGELLTLPGDLQRAVPDGASLSWLMPMAGG